MSSEAQYLNSKKYTYEYFSQQNVCRLCWKTTSNAKSIANDDALAKTIVEHIGLNIKGHILQKVCFTCSAKIESFANFKRLCLEADRKLEEILSTGRLKKIKNFENNYQDPFVLKKEVDLELKLLAGEVEKEERNKNWISKLEHNSSNSNLANFHLYYGCDNEYLPIKDNYCYLCDLNLESAEKKAKHNVEVHKMKQKTLYTCFICKKKFSKFSLKINHEIQCKPSNKTDSKPLEKDRLVSSPLKEKDKKQSNRKADLKQNHKVFKYRKCSMSFKNHTDIDEHKLKHREDKKCICEICGRMLSSRDALQQHMRIHKNYKELKCPHCDYRGTLKKNIDAHIRSVHMGERRYACHLCPRLCFSGYSLKVHIKTHYGIKDFKCHLCKKVYSKKLALQEHIKVDHQCLWRFKCKRCELQFKRMDNLRKHALSVHGIRTKQNKDDYVELDLEDKDQGGNENAIKHSRKEIWAVKESRAVIHVESRVEAESEVDAENGVDAESKAYAESEVDAESGVDAESEVDAENGVQAESGADEESSVDTESGAYEESKVDAKIGADEESGSVEETRTDEEMVMESEIIDYEVVTLDNDDIEVGGEEILIYW